MSAEEVGERVAGLGQRARLGVRDRGVDLGRDPVADPPRPRVVEQRPRAERLLEPRDRVRAPPLGDLVLAAVDLRIALEVADPADRVRLDERGSLAGACPGHGARDGVVDGEHVVAVHGVAGDPVARGAPRDRAAGGRERAGRRRGPAVVLAEEDDRQLPEGRQVHALVERAAVGGAVAEEREDHLARLPLPDREADTRGQDAARREDAVGAEVAHGRVGDVHRAALAVADAVRLAVELGHEAPERAALGDEVAVAAVRREDVVVGPERRARADGDGLLAYRGVEEAWDPAAGEQLAHALLEEPHAQHPRVHREQRRFTIRARHTRSACARGL